MQWNDVGINFLITSFLVFVLQVWWIASLLRRHRRRSGAEPLSSSAFRRELERIFQEQI